MEENYQTAVRRERTQSIQALNFELKYMIVGHITAFQGRNFLGTAFLWVVYKSILCSQKEKLFVLFLISLACCSQWLMVYFPVLWISCFWKKVVALSVDWYFKYLPNSRNRFKLSLCSQDHFKKKDWHGFFSRHFQMSFRCLMVGCTFWCSLVLPNHLQV